MKSLANRSSALFVILALFAVAAVATMTTLNSSHASVSTPGVNVSNVNTQFGAAATVGAFGPSGTTVSVKFTNGMKQSYTINTTLSAPLAADGPPEPDNGTCNECNNEAEQ